MKALKKVDVRSIEMKESKKYSAGLTITGAAMLVVGAVIFFAMMYMGVFVSATVKDAIPTDSLSTNMSNLMTSVEEKQIDAFNVYVIFPLFFAVFGLISLIMGLMR